MSFELKENYIVIPVKDLVTAPKLLLNKLAAIEEWLKPHSKNRKYICISDKYEDDYLAAVEIIKLRATIQRFKVGHPIWVRDNSTRSWRVVIYTDVSAGRYRDTDGDTWVHAEPYTGTEPPKDTQNEKSA